MKGKYIFDVAGLPNLSQMLQGKAVDLGCGDVTTTQAPTLKINLNDGVITADALELDEYKRVRGLGGFEEVGVRDFLRLEKPKPQVAQIAMAFVLAGEGEDQEVKTVTMDELKEMGVEITLDQIKEATQAALRMFA
jgi:hypothetical protein